MRSIQTGKHTDKHTNTQSYTQVQAEAEADSNPHAYATKIMNEAKDKQSRATATAKKQ